MTAPDAWLVVEAEGFRAVFLERVRAERWAAQCHGVIYPLGRLDGTGPASEPAVGVEPVQTPP
jgi:hypothetical protein